MECLNTVRSLSRYIEGALSLEERRAVDGHLVECSRCSDRFAEHRQMRAALRTLPRHRPSQDLQKRLKAISSRDLFRRRAHRTFEQKFARWREQSVLTLNNLMRPLMLPVAGGLASACLLFGLLVPYFTVEVHPVRNDVLLPVLYTQASVNYLMPIALADNELELDVRVDESGRMTEYHVISGENMLADPQMRRRLESTLLITQFNPATSFGQPTNGRIRVRMVRDGIEVKG